MTLMERKWAESNDPLFPNTKPEPPGRASAVGEDESAARQRALSGVGVLVVDDDPDICDLLVVVLGQAGARVTAVGSVAEAWESIQRAQPDVLVSDIGMPGEDGYALIYKVRSLAPAQGGGIPALALTAHNRVEDRARTLSAGFQLHVAKPVDPVELVAAIAHLIKGTRDKQVH